MSDLTTGQRVATIENPAALQELVRDCLSKLQPIVDYGVAHTGLGHAPPTEHVRLVQHGGVIEHYERDLTVRAAAGATLASLQKALALKNQFIPIDADGDITLGEVINHNMYGPLRVSYGSIRDLLLGLRFIDGGGRDIGVGGRTVKNVAGYDVTRFMVGSLGELGIVYEATLRTYAIPKHTRTVQLLIENPATLDDCLAEWLLSEAAPAAIVWHTSNQRWVGRLAYFGTEASTDLQFKSLEAKIDLLDGVQISGTDEIGFDRYLAEQAQIRSWRRRASAAVKVIVPAANTGEISQRIFADMEPSLNLEVLPLHGCIFVGGDFDRAEAETLDINVNQAAASVGGLRVWHQRPPGADGIVPFGPPQADWPLQQKLKQTMDPHGLFNPGRFLALEEQPA